MPLKFSNKTPIVLETDKLLKEISKLKTYNIHYICLWTHCAVQVARRQYLLASPKVLFV